MSDTSQGPGWWLASDGRWYPPEMWTGPPAARPAPEAGRATASSAPSVPPAVPPPVPGSPSGPSVSQPGQYQYPAQSQSPNQYPTQSQYPAQYQYPDAYGRYPDAYGRYPQYGTAQTKRTNGFAVASLVCSIVGLLFFLPAVVGIVFGFVARSQIRSSGGAQGGDGLAIAGIVVGFGVVLIFVIIFVVAASSTNTNGVLVPQFGADRVLIT